MQQLQQSYGGDRSESLAQIMGMQYQPQGATSAMAQQMLSSGMSASTALKTKQMDVNYLTNRDFQQRQNQLYDERKKALQSQIMLKNIMEGKKAALKAYYGAVASMYDERDPYQAEEKRRVLSGMNMLEDLMSGAPEQAMAASETMDKLKFSPATMAGGAQLKQKADDVVAKDKEAKKKSQAKENAAKADASVASGNALIDMLDELEKFGTPVYESDSPVIAEE